MAFFTKIAFFSKVTFLQVYTRKTRFFHGINSNQAEIWSECSLGGSLGLVEGFFEKKNFLAFFGHFCDVTFFDFLKKSFFGHKIPKNHFFQKSLRQVRDNHTGNIHSKFQLYRTLRWWEIVFCVFCWHQHFFQKNHTECEQFFFSLINSHLLIKCEHMQKELGQ